MIGPRLGRRFLRDRSGAQALEFAIIAPLLFATIFGVFEFGRVLYEQNRISGAAADAARTVSVIGSTDDQVIRNVIYDRLFDYDRNLLTINLTDEVIGTGTFKKIELSYRHSLLVNLGVANAIDISTTRYAPNTAQTAI